MRILCSSPEKCNRAIEVLYWIQVEKHENLHGQKIEKAKETWVPSTSKIEIPLQRQKNSHLSCFVLFYWSALTLISLLNSLTFEMFEEADLCHRCSSVLGHLWPCTLMLTTAPHLSPFPHFPHPDVMLQMTQTTEMVIIKNSLPTVRSSWFLSPKARSLYKQPLW